MNLLSDGRLYVGSKSKCIIGIKSMASGGQKINLGTKSI
jgi:hypothetical protein